MLNWLYDIVVVVVSFIMSLFGFDFKKKSVTFADDVKDTVATTVKTNEDTSAT